MRGRDQRPIRRYRQIHLLYNPAAGRIQRSRGALVPKLAEILKPFADKLTETPTTGAGEATTLARQAAESGADVLVVAGGDGTLNEAVNGLIGTSTRLAVLPLGTGNVLATEMGFRGSAEAAASSIGELVDYRVSAGLLRPTGRNPRHFLLMAGVGLDASIVIDLDPELKKWLGKLAYWIGGIAQLGRRFTEFDVRVESESLVSSFTLASRVRNYGGDIEIARNVSLLDDFFEVVAFAGEDSFRYIRYFTGVVARALEKTEGVTIRKARNLEFTPRSEEPVFVQVDGELAGSLPATIEFVPDALTLMMPESIGQRYQRAPSE